MGMYDEIEFTCPNCFTKTSSQTKLFNCTLKTFERGMNISPIENKRDYILRMKDKCPKCEKNIGMVVEDCKITGFTFRMKANLIERLFGYYYWMEEGDKKQ